MSVKRLAFQGGDHHEGTDMRVDHRDLNVFQISSNVLSPLWTLNSRESSYMLL
jgi:hypothetical protein